MIVVTFFASGASLSLFFTPLFSQIIATSHLQPPCHPLRSESGLTGFFTANSSPKILVESLHSLSSVVYCPANICRSLSALCKLPTMRRIG